MGWGPGGVDLEKVIARAAEALEVSQEEITGGGRYPRVVKARSVVSYWAVRELGIWETEVARRLGVTRSAVSEAVTRGKRIIEEKGVVLKEE